MSEKSYTKATEYFGGYCSVNRSGRVIKKGEIKCAAGSLAKNQMFV